MKRFAAICGALILVAIACASSAGWMLAHPIQTRIGNPPSDLNAQPVTFASDSGANVHAWWCPTGNGRGAVLLLPGIRANRLSMVDRARFLRRAGYSVLLIDFQATGETKGDHITFGWKESRDVLAAINFVHHIDPSDQVAIIGSSLGGVAALLATPPLKVEALVLEEVYPTHRCWFSVRDPPKKFGSCQTLDMSICTKQRGRNMKHESWLFLLRGKNRQKIRNHEVSLPNRNVFRAD